MISKIQCVQRLENAINILRRAANHLLNGQVIHSYRQMGHLTDIVNPEIDASGDKIRIISLIKMRLKQGDQLDAHDLIKSLIDRCNAERIIIIKNALEEQNR